jgi:hypothetical protein
MKLFEYINLQLCRISATYDENVKFIKNYIKNNNITIHNYDYYFTFETNYEKLGILLWKKIKQHPHINTIMGIPKQIDLKY